MEACWCVPVPTRGQTSTSVSSLKSGTSAGNMSCDSDLCGSPHCHGYIHVYIYVVFWTCSSSTSSPLDMHGELHLETIIPN